MIPRKHHIRSFWLQQLQCVKSKIMILTLIPLQNEHDGWGYAQNTKLLFRAEMIPSIFGRFWL